jgi:hypothetical protein
MTIADITVRLTAKAATLVTHKRADRLLIQYWNMVAIRRR